MTGSAQTLQVIQVQSPLWRYSDRNDVIDIYRRSYAALFQAMLAKVKVPL